MNTAEKEVWGDAEALKEYLRSVRRPGEKPNGYDSRHSFEFAVAHAKALGEAGETLFAELMKMKTHSEAKTKGRNIITVPKAAVA